jgi:hypothetical protein
VLEDRYLSYSSDIKSLHKNAEVLQRPNNMAFNEKTLQLSVIEDSIKERAAIQDQIIAEMKDIREEIAEFLTETETAKLQITLPTGELLGAWLQDGKIAISNYVEPGNS